MVVIWAKPIYNGHCAGTYCEVQPENSVLHVQGSLNLTFAHTGKFGQILCYTCDVVRMVHEQHDAACSGQRVEWSRYGQYQFEIGIVRARTVRFNLEIEVFRVQGSVNLTFAHTGKFGQILCYTCDVVRMVHEQHAAACSGQRVKWSRYGQYQFEIGIVRARTVRFNLQIRLFACKGA